MEIPTPFPRFAIFTRYVPVLDTTDSKLSHNHNIHVANVVLYRTRQDSDVNHHIIKTQCSDNRQSFTVKTMVSDEPVDIYLSRKSK